MKQVIKRFVNAVMPFFLLGIGIVLFIIGFIIVSYILLIGALLALIVFIFAYIRYRYYQHKLGRRYHQQSVHSHGRIVEHDSHESEK